MRTWIVIALEQLCGVLDRVPGQWGCRWGLAELSTRLDDRWGTGVWDAC